MCIEASQSESVAVRALNFVDDRTNESRCSEVIECSFVYFLHKCVNVDNFQGVKTVKAKFLYYYFVSKLQ